MFSRTRPARLPYTLLAACALLASSPHATRAGEIPVTDDIKTVVEGNSQFAIELLAALRDNPGGNLFLSPQSISTALAMTSAGARGETAQQMAQVLHLTLPPEQLHPAFAALTSSQTEGDSTARGALLEIANRLWLQDGYPIQPDFQTITRAHYQAGLERVDFARDPEAARLAINAWVADQTHDKIRDLLPPGVLNPLSRLVLTNAIYFLGTWKDPFDEKLTKPLPFHTTAEASTPTPMMARLGTYHHAAADGLALLELPYGRGDLAMVILLPNTIDGLAALEESLTLDRLTTWVSALRPRPVRVTLPRFKLESQFQLSGTLKQMGMPLPFDQSQADFSGIDGRRDLFISEVIHKAFVAVDEQGTEAAAATAVAIGIRAARPIPPTDFKADHPFLFLIRDTRNGSILFLGRLRNPSA